MHSKNLTGQGMMQQKYERPTSNIERPTSNNDVAPARHRLRLQARRAGRSASL
ncbi:MAG: hypothetical protein KKG97_01340 [Proteobacteria bacterium]|nr:hypothetical protein [Pseudomonadota bacterium]